MRHGRSKAKDNDKRDERIEYKIIAKMKGKSLFNFPKAKKIVFLFIKYEIKKEEIFSTWLV